MLGGAGWGSAWGYWVDPKGIICLYFVGSLLIEVLSVKRTGAFAFSLGCMSPAEGRLTLTEVTAAADPSHRVKTRRQPTEASEMWRFSGNWAAWWVVRAFPAIGDNCSGKEQTLNSDSNDKKRKDARGRRTDWGVCVVFLCGHFFNTHRKELYFLLRAKDDEIHEWSQHKKGLHSEKINKIS